MRFSAQSYIIAMLSGSLFVDCEMINVPTMKTIEVY